MSGKGGKANILTAAIVRTVKRSSHGHKRRILAFLLYPRVSQGKGFLVKDGAKSWPER